ncbi:MAG: hypothetical protein K6C10_11220 [Prevotella sp.]|nr:hypothetical protein [Prevotella sp.]
MKKVLFAVAALAFTFASCGNKTNAPAEAVVDSTEVALEEANEAADATVAELSTLLDGKDAGALQTALEAVKAKVAEFIAKNPVVAKEYLAKVQNFLKENADKVKALVGDNAAVGAAVAALTDTSAESIVDGLVSNLTDAKDAAVDAAADAVDGAKEAVEDAKQAVTDKANEAVDNAKEKAGAAVDDAAAAAKKKLGL